MGLSPRILTAPEAVEPHVAAWDELARARQLPYCAPGWLLPWWNHMAPPDGVLRIVAVLDGASLAGIVPLYASPWRLGLARYALLGTEDLTARVEPLARPGREQEVAAAAARALASARPVPALLRLEGIPAGSPWPDLLGGAWPGRGRPFVHRDSSAPAPIVPLSGSFEDWMAAKSGNFRQQMRRSRRKLEQAGATFRTAGTAEEVERALPEFERLHRARWDPRGGSGALRPGLLDMLAEAGERLVPGERFELNLIEVDGRMIGAHIFVAAGGETSYWLGGFDDDYGAQRPSMLALLDELERCFARGDDRFDLGPGGQDYKYRFADSDETLEWMTLVPPGPQHARAMALLLPRRARYGITTRLSTETKARLRRVLGRPLGR